VGRIGILRIVTSYNGYRGRSVDEYLLALTAELPAVSVVGPRACGKTTTARRLAATTVRLDRAAEAAAFLADPDVALRGLAEPVLLDEWQEAPAVLGAVKRAVDDDPRPGRFLLTGSARIDLDAQTWPGTGRLVRVPMYGLTTRELRGNPDGTPFTDRIRTGSMSALQPGSPADLADYVEAALRSGFPEPAIRLSDRARTVWLDSYVDQLITRDAASLGSSRDPSKLRRYLEALAVNSAGVADEQTLIEAAAVDRRTAVAYEQLLRNLLVLDALPAWTTNRLTRLVKTPKRLLVDASLVSAVLRLDARAIQRDGNMLGRIIETFVVSQLRPELDIAESRPRLYHLRDRGGRHEIDLLVEYGDGDVAAIEVKASSAPTARDARHLAWLRDELGDRFTTGVVLHTGPRTFELGERIIAAPISTLWF
jgi:predicted AAA+ superfamily ATPase